MSICRRLSCVIPAQHRQLQDRKSPVSTYFRNDTSIFTISHPSLGVSGCLRCSSCRRCTWLRPALQSSCDLSLRHLAAMTLWVTSYDVICDVTSIQPVAAARSLYQRFATFIFERVWGNTRSKKNCRKRSEWRHDLGYPKDKWHPCQMSDSAIERTSTNVHVL